MSKKPKWKVHISKTINYYVDVDETEGDGINSVLDKAFEEVVKDPNYYEVCESIALAGIFINDYESRFYYPYIAEKLPNIPKLPEIENKSDGWESNSQ